MRYLTGFIAFWYDFIIGDDWTIAAAVVASVSVTAVLARATITAWWLLPVVVILFLGASLWRLSRAR